MPTIEQLPLDALTIRKGAGRPQKERASVKAKLERERKQRAKLFSNRNAKKQLQIIDREDY